MIAGKHRKKGKRRHHSCKMLAKLRLRRLWRCRRRRRSSSSRCHRRFQLRSRLVRRSNK